jgi:type I restriction enzyme, S subunit
VVPEDVGEANVNQAVAVVTCNEKLHPFFLLYLLLSQKTQLYLHRAKVLVARANISLKDLKDLKFPLSSMELQIEFANRVEEIREMEAAQDKSRKRLDDSFQSLLHRAFNGEL